MKRLAKALDKRWIETRMDVVPQTVRNWRTGVKVTKARFDDLVAAVREVLPDTEESAPAWAEALADETAKKVIEALAPADLRAAAALVIERLEAIQPQGGGSAPAPAASAAPGEVDRLGQGRE